MKNRRKHSLPGIAAGLFFALMVLFSAASASQAHAIGNYSFKVLSIGNSFSVNATKYLYQLAKEAGFENVVVGNAYINGCDIKTHCENVKGDKAVYTYEKNVSGIFDKSENVTLKSALTDEAWDYIVFQQASKYSGMESSYNEDLEYLISYAKKRAKLRSPFVKFAWHMTWAYKDGSKNKQFAEYDYDSEKMYNAIVSASLNKIASNKNISCVIPSGTAMRNVRSSYIGNHMYRDNKHMNDLGSYILGLNFIKALTGKNIDNISWIPSESDIVLTQYLPVLIEAVDNACSSPYAVTLSAYKCNHAVSPENIINTLKTNPAVHATCTEKGCEAYYTCVNCDFTTYKETPALGHECVSHEGKDASCTEKGIEAYETCKRCDYTTYKEIPTLGHDFVKHDGKAATCTQKGWNEYLTCSRCSYTTYKEIQSVGHIEVVDEAIPATCAVSGKTQGKHCAVCAAVLIPRTTIPPTGCHKYLSWVVGNTSTCNVETRICAVCKTSETRPIDKSKVQTYTYIGADKHEETNEDPKLFSSLGRKFRLSFIGRKIDFWKRSLIEGCEKIMHKR